MLSRREALLGVLLAPLIKPVAGMLPKATDPRPWKAKWKEVLVHVPDPLNFAVGDSIHYFRDPVDVQYKVHHVEMKHEWKAGGSGGLLLLRRRNGR